MKTEIEHTQHLLHMAKVKVQQEFEAWWQNQVAKGGGASRCAWRTPPISTQLQKPLPQHSAVSSECSVVSSSGQHQSSGRHSEKQSSGHHSSRPGQTSDQSGAAIRNAPLVSRTPSHSQLLFRSSHLSPPPHSKLDPLTTPRVVPLTGDPRADADILAFCRAKQHLLNNRGPR
ncbi:Kinesin-like protein KIF6 [Geodia barretti]|nr:Kinesin-like protein KIF6 [Geodia barretti]